MENNRELDNFIGSKWGGHHSDLFYHIISTSNLLSAWREFRRGKNKKTDIQKFEFNLEKNILDIHFSLRRKTYINEPYVPFYVCDPKIRHIHKAQVRDRVVHQAVFRQLYKIYDPSFIYDSYACRFNKGTHAGVERLESFLRKETKNYKNNAWVLKCDISKFFDSIDHEILKKILFEKIECLETKWLLENIIKSFEKLEGKGLPLGNVTSQLFANVYMNVFDQFMKHVLKVKYYARYCDDFVCVSKDKYFLELLLPKISEFLEEKLKLKLHPKKVEIRKVSQGVDFLGYVVLTHYKVLRTSTKKRILRKVKQNLFKESKFSYLGILSHCRGYKLSKFFNDKNLIKALK
ncbi:reverse transcriptase/maturase family protein [Candidatus Nomurabacteria bacterium]|nr:reverse transcriptase/maturase family protein [Candidatus Nomurabacteria bacterium]